jgi:hypothetical protein
MLRWFALAGIMVAVFGIGTADAQESGRVGLVMGYPASLGVQWHVSDRVAFRPDVSLLRSSGDSTSPGSAIGSTSTSWSAGVGVSVVLYLGTWEGLRTYVSPRFSFARNSSSAGPAGGTRSDNWSNTYTAAGSWGAQYALGRRFSVFGEVGLSYARQTSSFTSSLPNVLGTDATASTVSTRSAVGAIVYF